MDADKIKFTDKTVKFEKITLSRKKNKQKPNYIRFGERNKMPIDCKYINQRITFNGALWLINTGIGYADNTKMSVNAGVEISNI